MSKVTGKKYANSMADFTLYKRYFALIILLIFFLIAIYMAFTEYEAYNKHNDEHAHMMMKISLGFALFFIILICLTSISIYFIKRMTMKQRSRIEAFNRTTNAVNTAFDIFKR